jgi:hypothetical protein
VISQFVVVVASWCRGFPLYPLLILTRFNRTCLTHGTLFLSVAANRPAVERPRREAAMKKRSYYDDEQEVQENEEAHQTEAMRGHVAAERPTSRPLAAHKVQKTMSKPSGGASSSEAAPSDRAEHLFSPSAAHGMASHPHLTSARDMWREYHGSENREYNHLSSETHCHRDTGSNEHENHVMLCGMSGPANYASEYSAMTSGNLHLSHLYGGAMDENSLDEMHLDAPEQEARWLRQTFENMYNTAAKGQSHSNVSQDAPPDNEKLILRTSPAIFKMDHDGKSDWECSTKDSHCSVLQALPAGDDKLGTSPAIFKMENSGMSELQCPSAWQQGCSDAGMSWEQSLSSSTGHTHDSDFGCFFQHAQSRPTAQDGPQKCTVMYHYV